MSRSMILKIEGGGEGYRVVQTGRIPDKTDREDF